MLYPRPSSGLLGRSAASRLLYVALLLGLLWLAIRWAVMLP
ncbi:hypothetical protein J2X76_000663 [Neorhizobium sp. 2083]|nr:hypothetical protein [Neorhizobium sp. 2083]MDR6815509.1 hypothetical protein [Neorhizobium sp. 2083]